LWGKEKALGRKGGKGGEGYKAIAAGVGKKRNAGVISRLAFPPRGEGSDFYCKRGGGAPVRPLYYAGKKEMEGALEN